MGPTWGPSGAYRTQVGPMLAPWTLLSGNKCEKVGCKNGLFCVGLRHGWRHCLSNQNWDSECFGILYWKQEISHNAWDEKNLSIPNFIDCTGYHGSLGMDRLFHPTLLLIHAAIKINLSYKKEPLNVKCKCVHYSWDAWYVSSWNARQSYQNHQRWFRHSKTLMKHMFKNAERLFKSTQSVAAICIQ